MLVTGICINYMHDLDWLRSEAPYLCGIPLALLYHYIEGDTSQWPHLHLHKPPVPPYGTHHTKCLILAHDGGRQLRVCVQTANNLYTDNYQLTDAVWAQDFPAKPPANAAAAATAGAAAAALGAEERSEFEDDLVDYLQQSAWPGIPVPRRGHVGPDALRAFDFRAARAVLVPSVPGAHAGPRLHRYGHMRLRAALAARRFPARFRGAGMVWQASSVGAVPPPWLAELRDSFSAGRADAPGAPPLGPPAAAVRVVWPTMEEVRGSRLGWAMGGSLPGARDKVDRLRRPDAAGLVRLCRWGGAGSPEGRERSMPHVKTYLRHAGGPGGVAWVVVGSHNLSAAAWGRLERAGSQLRIRSFELSVLLLPSLLVPAPPPPAAAAAGADADAAAAAANREPCDFTTTAEAAAASGDGGGGAARRVALPLPYALPPEEYGVGDVPWAWDVPLAAADAFGRTFPRGLAGR
jgi:tyrosyl-DNA phosphodiesterase 1